MSSGPCCRIHADIARGPLDAAVAPGTGATLISRCPAIEFLDILIITCAEKANYRTSKKKEEIGIE